MLGAGYTPPLACPLALPGGRGQYRARRQPLVIKECPMPLFSFEGKSPRMHPTAFIAPTANLIGDVTVEENVSVWYKICALNATRRPKPTGSTSGRSPSRRDSEFAQ